jgi:hypothetical protein
MNGGNQAHRRRDARCSAFRLLRVDVERDDGHTHEKND